jgi:HD-GYP domain-containing protein (c-di-GMP phosphodiesterase class II)
MARLLVSLIGNVAQIRKPEFEWDVFISHASEDKASIARPLAEALLAKGLRVWYDEYSLKVGDSLRQMIDQGLENSRFGVVVLSAHFFRKNWPRKELDGLVTREVENTKVILPVWHRVAANEVRRYSRTLAGVVAAQTKDGIPHVVNKLLEVISPEIVISSDTAEYLREFEAHIELDSKGPRARGLDLERSFYFTLETLGDALDLRHGNRKGRSRRVTAFAIAIARAMGLSREQIAVIARAALIHDVGKIDVPDTILRKPGKLTSDEIAVMRDHAYRGYQRLKKIPFLAEASEIVRSHRERFDGTGYPQELKGTKIPLGARILSVADSLDAITSERPYRRARSFPEARLEIEEWSGRQFDPKVVKVFMKVPEKVWSNLDEELHRTTT